MKNSSDTVQWQNLPKYSFNAKELDEETGMYYYEARYYAPPMFISRDPLMSEKPWLTPYHYCSNNPVGRIDPSGCEDGDYYNWNGKYLGWDGVDDDQVHFVNDSNSKETIKNNNRNGKITSINDVSIDVSVTRDFLREGPLDVDHRTEENGNYREEATYFPIGGGQPIRKTGVDIRTLPSDIEPTVPIPNVELEASVHSHISYTRIINENNKKYQWCALIASDADKKVKTNLNIITGINRTNENRLYLSNVAAFYDSNWNLKGYISIFRLKKIADNKITH
ncbi:MAG: RHS repeat-associated core domain-containing protein [Bacteroidales bacterium]|nr:RHS repeat-associated core domain-containing protein [Bacteroidales bacterium]